MTRRFRVQIYIGVLAAVAIAGGHANAGADTPPGLNLPDGRESVAVPIHRGGNLLFVEAKINGQDAGFFMLDTGAVLNILDPTTAARLGLEGSGEGIAFGVGGAQQGKYLQVKSLRLGDETDYVTLGPHTMTTMDVSHLKQLFGERFSGLLGTPLWEKLPYTLDYEQSHVKFYSRESFSPPKDAVEVPLKIVDGWPTVPAQVNQKFDGTLLLDSGHEGGLDIAATFAAAHRDLFSGKGTPRGVSQGLGGQRADLSTTLDELKLFGHRFTKVPTTYRARPHPGGNQPSADIGMSGGQQMRQFRLTFDYKAGRAWGEWR
ncbi:MAG: aspartyl protease family protein, partial [Pirellulales bacterium]